MRTFHFKKRVAFNGPDYGDIDKWMEENGPKLEDFKEEKAPGRVFEDVKRKLYGSKAQEFLKVPQVSEEFKEPNTSIPVVDLKADYGHRGLQIVVDIRSIYLTPEKPTSPDTPEYHLEGIPVRAVHQFLRCDYPMVLNLIPQNDHICAVAKYYYDVDNVATAKRLAITQPEKVDPYFRVNEDWHTSNSDWFRAIFGLENRAHSVKAAGMMDIREGRLITFPNLLFSSHNRLRLVDNTKNGHCKVLTLLLVDPNIRIISSAIVPCQQYDWWVKEMMADGGPLGGLPCELRMEVVRYIPEWDWSGSEYPKAPYEEGLLYKRRFVHRNSDR